MSKLLWPLLVVNLRIPGLIWRGKAYFVQNSTSIGLPDDTRRTTSEVPCRTPAVHFWRQINSLEAQNISYFSLFTIWYGFWNCKSLFVHIFCHFQWEKRLDFSAFPDFLTWRQDTKIFLSAECWLVNSNFPRASRMEGKVKSPKQVTSLEPSGYKFNCTCAWEERPSCPKSG